MIVSSVTPCSRGRYYEMAITLPGSRHFHRSGPPTKAFATSVTSSSIHTSSLSLCASSVFIQKPFPTDRRIHRRPLDVTATPDELELWAKDVSLSLGPLVPLDRRIDVIRLLYTYRHLQGGSLDNLPPTDLIQHRVRLQPGTKPKSYARQKRWPPHKEYWLRKLIQDGIQGGIFERTQSANGELSAWNYQAVLVDKVENPTPQDKPRLTFNYSAVKEDMPGNLLELPSKVHDYLSDPRHKIYFYADIKHGYFAVQVHPDDRYLFAFTIPGIGQLQPTRMPQGTGSAGFTMTELMNIAFGPIPDPYPEPSLLHTDDPIGVPHMVFYMDDLFGGGESFEDLFPFLSYHFLPRIEWAGLRLSFKKLRLFVDEVVSLGVLHKANGQVRILSERIEKILRWPIPTTVRGVRAFLGTIGITRRWVKNFGEIARPLQRLTGKVSWRWSLSEQLSFDILKIKCASRTAMHGIDWSLICHFYTDASKFATGLCVIQIRNGIHYPILYDSFMLTESERRYPTYKRELLAIVRYAQKYNYLLQNPRLPAVFHTDHKPLARFLNSDKHEGIYAYWVVILRELAMNIEYIPGPRNKVADGLSRTIFHASDCSEDPSVSDIQAQLNEKGPQWIWSDDKDGYEAFLSRMSDNHMTEIIDKGTFDGVPVFYNRASESWTHAYENSLWYGHIYAGIQDGTRWVENMEVKDGYLWKFHPKYGPLLCIPEDKVRSILHEAHDQSGHFGKTGTLAKLTRWVYRPKQSDDVDRYIDGCIYCVQHAPAQRAASLYPISAALTFKLSLLDSIDPIRPPPGRHRYILNLVEYFSRRIVAYPTKTCGSADVRGCLGMFFMHYPKPELIYWDYGTHFENEPTQAYLTEVDIRFEHSPSGSSKSTGMVEMSNRILESVLRKGDQDWDLRLSESVSHTNNRIIHHLRYSPNEILFGYPPLLSAISKAGRVEARFFQSDSEHIAAMSYHLSHMAEVKDIVRKSSDVYRERFKARYDRGIHPYILAPGQKVFLFQKDVGKLEPRWRGPFIIESLLDHAPVTLQHIDGRKIPRKFHRDHIKPLRERTGYLRDPEGPESLPPVTIRQPRLKKRVPISSYPPSPVPKVTPLNIPIQNNPPTGDDLLQRILDRRQEIESLQPRPKK